MTFTKPSNETNTTGAYTYKQSFGSPAADYIDNEFPNCLDKTGDNNTNGGGITGVISINSGGQINSLAGGGIVIQSGSGMGVFSGGNVDINSGAVITVAGTENVFSGGILNMESGSAFRVLSGGAAYILSGGNLFIDNGGGLEATSGANVTLYGGSTTMSDNESPYLDNTALPRNIVQPLILMSGGPLGSAVANYVTGQYFQDNITYRGPYDLMLTKLPNGCTITGFKIGIATIAAPTSADASASLYSVNNTTGALSSALATIVIPTGLSGGTFYLQGPATCSVSVDDSTYSYFVRVEASSTQTLKWYAPIIEVTLSTIAQLF